MSIQDKARAGRAANVAARKQKPKKPLTPGQIKWLEQKAKSDAAAAVFKRMCVASGLPLPVREYRFAQEAMGREWEADFAWPDERIILEVEGGAWAGGRHTRGSGYLEDMRKYNAMSLLGFALLRCTPKTLCTPETVNMVADLIRARTARTAGEVPAGGAP